MSKRIDGAALTHRGRVKQNNEDAAILHIQEGTNGYRRGLLMIADGVGGHLAGEVASDLAIQTVYDSLARKIDGQDPDLLNEGGLSEEQDMGAYLTDLLQRTIQRANQLILDYASEHQQEARNLGTTATCGVVYDNLLVLGHVGDSRAYLLREGKLQQLTEDHTFVGELVRQGQLSSEALYDHPRRHVIMRALGQNSEVKADTNIIPLQAGDRLLLCSDGLWEMVRDEYIQSLLLDAETPEEAIQQLFSSAMDAGGVDNIGIVVGDINE